jgi:hypothetical protein
MEGRIKIELFVNSDKFCKLCRFKWNGIFVPFFRVIFTKEITQEITQETTREKIKNRRIRGKKNRIGIPMLNSDNIYKYLKIRNISKSKGARFDELYFGLCFSCFSCKKKYSQKRPALARIPKRVSLNLYWRFFY